MDSIQLLDLKNNTKYQILDEKIISEINNLFSNSNIKFKNKKYKKTSNILKNNNFQLNKNKIENKTILILNKVSNDNINKLVVEFLQNVNIKLKEDYELIQKIFFIKLVKEINMIDNYFNLFIYIFSIIYNKLKFEPTFFINILENKICFDYKDIQLSDNFQFISEYKDELYRINTLKIIKYFIFKNFLGIKVKKDLDSILLEQNKYIPDISFWFDKKEIDRFKQQIFSKIDLCSCMRDKILLENLLDDIVDIKINIDTNKLFEDTNEEDSFSNLVENIMEEFLYLESTEEIKEFIINDCLNADKKNIFCSIAIKHFFDQENVDVIIKLFSYLIKNKIIFKSNLSRGLVLYISNNEINDITKIKKLLQFLKSNNITKNIEYIFKKYKMKTYYDY